MTICIAAISDTNSGKNKVVLASDRMITMRMPPQEFEHGTPKMEMISNTCAVLTAGSALAQVDLCRAVRSEIGVLVAPTISQIVDKIKECFVKERQRRVEEYILRPRGFNLRNFYSVLAKELPPQISVSIDSDIMSYKDFNLEILIAGVDREGGHIYEVGNPGTSECFDRIGYDAIGSGEYHALRTFIVNDYTSSVTLKKALYYVYEAKKWSENAPGVGKAIDMYIIDEHGINTLSAENIKALENIYQTKTTMEKSQEAEIIGMIEKIEIKEDRA